MSRLRDRGPVKQHGGGKPTRACTLARVQLQAERLPNDGSEVTVDGMTVLTIRNNVHFRKDTVKTCSKTILKEKEPGCYKLVLLKQPYIEYTYVRGGKRFFKSFLFHLNANINFRI